MSPRPSLLILSFSPIATDARVLRQVRLLADDYDVTTCGYGPAPEGVVRHYEMPRAADYQDMDGRLISLHLYRAAYWRISSVRWVRAHVPRDAFDIVLANEVEAVPVAQWLRPALGVHADLHEYTPLLKEEFPSWRRRITPFYEWVCRRYVTRADSWTTVSTGLAEAYERNFGFRPGLVTNAAPLSDREPTPVHDPIRLVHGGACLRNRRLEVLIEAMERTSAPVTLDLYLAPNDPGFLAELREYAQRVPSVTLHDAVPYEQLIPTLAQHDVGVHVLPPTNSNNAWALPNKLFEFAQARLGVVVGPTPEMAEYVHGFGFGAVTEGFDTDHLVTVLDQLDAATVAEWKASSHAHAVELSAQSQLPVWKAAIARIAERAGERS